MKPLKYLFLTLLLAAGYIAGAQTSKTDTIIVKSYSGIQVFYNCKPLHAYWKMGSMESKAPVHHVSQAFTKYVLDAQDQYPGCTGIIIDDVHFDNDHFDVIRTLQPVGYHDTAVIESTVFMAAAPTRPYEVANTMRCKVNWGSLKSNLKGLSQKANEQLVQYDGIIVDDLDFGFGKDDIKLIRWKSQ